MSEFVASERGTMKKRDQVGLEKVARLSPAIRY
jgi:hypothetical protein